MYNTVKILKYFRTNILQLKKIFSIAYRNVQSISKVTVSKTTLRTKDWRSSPAPSNSFDYEAVLSSRAEASDEAEACTTLRIRCRPVLSGSTDSYLIVDPRTGDHIYQWPWLAAIFVDGRYRCSALLLEPDWLLTSSSCTQDIRQVNSASSKILSYVKNNFPVR